MKRASVHVTDQAIVLWRNAFAAVPALVLVIFIEKPVIGTPFYYAIPIACTVDVFAIAFMSKALRSSTMGRTVPMLSFTPVFLLLTSWLILGEFPTIPGLIGVFTVVGGSYYLGRRGAPSHLLEPFFLMFRDIGTRYMLGAAACFSIAGPYFKEAVMNSSPQFALAFSLPLSSVLALGYHLLSGGNLKNTLPKRGNIHLILLGLSVFGVALCTNLAFEIGLTSYVVSIKRLSIVFNILIGAYFLGEEELGKNLGAAAVMVGGAVLIALS